MTDKFCIQSPVDSEDEGERNNPEPSIPEPTQAKKVAKRGRKKSKKGAGKQDDEEEQKETEDQKEDKEKRGSDGTPSPQKSQQ